MTAQPDINKTPSPVFTAALEYAEVLGWKIHPLHSVNNGKCSCGQDCGRSAGKHPHIGNWTETASNEPEKIKQWFKMWPDANVGIPTGRTNGILVVDIDGLEGVKSLERFNIPETVTVETGRDGTGRHIYFKYPELLEVKSTAAILPGVDIRANGGQVVAPPSTHYTGRVYNWLNSPFEMELAECPDWLLEIFKKNEEREAEFHSKRATDFSRIGRITQEDLDEAGRTANGFLKRCESLSWNGYQQWRSTAVWANALDRAFNSGSYFYNIFCDASKRHPEYRKVDELTLRNSFSRLDSIKLNFEGLGLVYDPKSKQAKDPNAVQVNLDLSADEVKKARAKSKKVNVETGEVLDGDEDDSFLAEFIPTDDGNAEAFRAVYGHKFTYCGAYGWLYWTGKQWKTGLAEAKLHEKVVEVFKRRAVAAIQANKNDVVKATVTNQGRINACKDALALKLSKEVEEFDSNPELLNCQNGVVNLKTGEITEHSPEQLFTYCIPVDYNPMADYSEWLNFLNQVVGGGEPVIQYLQKAIGYTLTGHTSEECLFYLYGPTRSGKGTFTEALIELMGDLLAVETDFNTFTAKRDADSSNFDLAPLKPARAVFASESTRYQSLNPAKIKQLTGGNQVRCSFKHKDFFNYRPQYKIWMSSNWPVNGDVDDEALWGRLRVIEFPNSFLGKEDKGLKHRIKSKKVLEGILTWAVQGAIEWYKTRDKGLQTPQEIRDTTNEHRVDADFVQMWIDETCEVDETAWTSNSAVMASYRAWCLENGTEPKQMRALSTTLKAKGFFTGIQRKASGANSKGVQGLAVIVTK